MYPQYTEFYETYKENGGEEYAQLWALFPSFTLEDLNLNMYNMFYKCPKKSIIPSWYHE